MSLWTNINATIQIDFGKQTRYHIEQFFGSIKDKEYSFSPDPSKKGKGLEITGSEMNAVVTYVPLREFDNDPRSRYWRGNTWVVTVNGRLRDRTFENTLEEWRRFAWKLGMFVRESAKLDGLSDDDNTMRFAEFDFWSVDIIGCSMKGGCWHDVWYHRSSVKPSKELTSQ